MSDETKNDAESGRGKYFRTLFTCIILSIVFLVIVRLVYPTSNAWLSILASMAPLGYYHLGYLTPLSKKGLSQAAIDSVYYYGFLVTVVALGVSALSLVRAGANGSLTLDPSIIISQFGVGLFATGYAVMARMHLSSVSLEGQEERPDVIIDDYIRKSRAMIDYLDETLRDFGELAKKSRAAVASLEGLSKDIAEENAKTLKALAALFEGEMKSILAETRDSLVQTRGMISDAAFTAERKAFATSIKSLSATTAKLNNDIEGLGSATNIAADKTTATADASARLASKISEVNSQMERMSQASVSFSSAVKTIEGELQESGATIKQQISASTNAIAEDLKRSTESASLLTDKLIQVANTIIDRTNQQKMG